jgi:hypothetical protein
MERTETPVLWRKLPATEIPVPVAIAPAPYSASNAQLPGTWKCFCQARIARARALPCERWGRCVRVQHFASVS